MTPPDTAADQPPPGHSGIAGTLARAFINSKLTPLLILASLLLGLAAVLLLPREEEPQIKVPMIDVIVSMPGSGAPEIEDRVTRPMEKLLYEIPGVEYVYSITREGMSLVIVRFLVGHDLEAALVKLNQKLQTNFDRIPHGVSVPMVKPRTIDNVPILAVTFHSPTLAHFELRRIAAQVHEAVAQVPQVAETSLIGGARREVRVQLDPARLSSRGLAIAGIIPMLEQANRQLASGSVTTSDTEVLVETGAFLRDAREVASVVVGVYAGKPVYLRDVADVTDGPAECTQYVLFGRGAASAPPGPEQPAVTLTVAKRPGTNAVTVADRVLRKVEQLRGRVIPPTVETTVTRHYGDTAAEKSNELLFHMAIAVLSVAALIFAMLGWREACIVALAIPSTLALTLLTFYLSGYTLNRITLFALIFSIGILVDDAIVVVENITRHYRMPERAGRRVAQVAVEAVAEVGNPTVLATWAVIAAIAPMAFVGGLMGPYMRPIPVGASAAMLFSLVIAFVVTPWASLRLLRSTGGHVPEAGPGDTHGEREGLSTRLYRHVMGPIIRHSLLRWTFLTSIVALLLAACAMVALGLVKVKMLPFDNKNEFQVILNMPEGSSLERTTRAAREIAAAVRAEPEVVNYQVYAGTASPFNFNGLVRHYYMRGSPHEADIQVNLLGKHDRDAQSHDIALRVRPRVAAIADRYGARVAVAEVPPGPPVLQTIVAEVYGPSPEARLALATRVRDIFRATPGVVDVDWYVEADQPKVRFIIDKEKAALNGVSAASISRTLRVAVEGESVDLVHIPNEREDVNLVLDLPRALRSSPDDMLALKVRPGDGNALPESTLTEPPPLIPLRELIHAERGIADKSIHHKNLLPVTYVIADVAGEVESPVYAIGTLNRELARLNAPDFGGPTEGPVTRYNLFMPFNDLAPAIKWDGEWHITLEVFRDLGLAFIAALLLIYLLMVGWFRSFVVPVVVMAAIPFSLIGIMPAHWAMGAFFSATSMIGFMAGAGIVVRNSIILVDFIELRRREGMPLADAVIDAGAVRFRPMLLTAMAVVVGAAVILFDPIFQGLALALMAGEIASLIVSRMAVPVLYYMAAPGNEAGA